MRPSIFAIAILILVVLASYFLLTMEDDKVPLEITNEKPTGSPMADAALELISTLDEEQKEEMIFSFSDNERFDWNYVPTSRNGLTLKDMSDEQEKALEKLLKTTLSEQGYEKTKEIIVLEGILGELEGNPSYRDSGKYYLSIFGEPSSTSPWGWRYEGHHLSLNFTSVAPNNLYVTPEFMGANPAVVKSGSHEGKRVLKNEEIIARKLLNSLDQDQKDKAIIDEEAYPEILTENDRHIEQLAKEGIPVSALNEEQKKILRNLLAVYVDNMLPEIANAYWKDIENAGFENIVFAWAGSEKPGEGHYYRIQGPTLLIEYDNTQNNANHIHTVWRDWKNDFGEDVLKKHYENDH